MTGENRTSTESQAKARAVRFNALFTANIAEKQERVGRPFTHVSELMTTTIRSPGVADHTNEFEVKRSAKTFTPQAIDVIRVEFLPPVRVGARHDHVRPPVAVGKHPLRMKSVKQGIRRALFTTDSIETHGRDSTQL